MFDPDNEKIQTTIRARSLKVGYKQITALDLPRLKLRGNIIAIIGHNGAGKSTFLKTALKLLKPRQGGIYTRYELHGSGHRLAPEENMAFCPEMGAVFADIAVESYIKLWCRIKLGDSKYYLKSGSRYIEALRLEPLLKRLGRELSKGERRRVQTAIGFLTDPKVFLFDEPFCGLDVQRTSELAELIREESKRMSFVISSHRMDVVERLADQVLVLKNGREVTSGPVRDVSLNLCSQSARITNVSNTQKIISALKERYSDCHINRLADQIVLSGPNFTIDTLCETVHQIDQNGANIQLVQPSLVDALNFHLKELRDSR